MIVYLKNSEINREQWDNCIRASRYFKPYAYSWYLDIMAPGWEALVDDDYDSVFPLPGFSRFGIHYISTPAFLQQLGAFSPDKPASGVIHEFIDFMPRFYMVVDLCVGQRVDYSGYKTTGHVNLELDLSLPYENIRNNFSSDCTSNIRIAEENKIETTDQVSPDELIDLFLFNKEIHSKGLKSGDYKRLSNLMSYCIQNSKGKITGVRDGMKSLISGVFIVEIPGSKTILFTANSPESHEKKIGYFIINELIKENALSRTILDFAGSSIPEIASFNESFGSKNNPYYRIYRNMLPWPIRMLK